MHLCPINYFSKKILIKLRILIFLLRRKSGSRQNGNLQDLDYISVGSFDCPCFSLNATLAQICWSLFFSSSSVCFWMTQAGDKRLSHIRLKELPAVLFECGHFQAALLFHTKTLGHCNQDAIQVAPSGGWKSGVCALLVSSRHHSALQLSKAINKGQESLLHVTRAQYCPMRATIPGWLTPDRARRQDRGCCQGPTLVTLVGVSINLQVDGGDAPESC